MHVRYPLEVFLSKVSWLTPNSDRNAAAFWPDVFDSRGTRPHSRNSGRDPSLSLTSLPTPGTDTALSGRRGPARTEGPPATHRARPAPLRPVEHRPIDPSFLGLGGMFCYLRVSIAGGAPRTLTLKLDDINCPITSNNFAKLCSSPATAKRNRQNEPTYRGTDFHR